VASFCNATSGGGAQGLDDPWGLYTTSDNTLCVTDYDADRAQAYPSFSRDGVTIMAIEGGNVQDSFVHST